MQRERSDRICASVCRCAEPGGFPGGSPAGRAVPDVERRSAGGGAAAGLSAPRVAAGAQQQAARGTRRLSARPAGPGPGSRRRRQGRQRQEEGAGGARPGPGRGRPPRDGAPAPVACGSRAPGGPRCARPAGE